MSNLENYIEQRMRVIHDLDFKQPEDLKPVSTRMTPEEIEKMSNVASVLDMSKSEFIRVIVSKSCDDIIAKYNMKFDESVGMSATEMLEFEQMTPQERKEYLSKLRKEDGVTE